MCDKRRGWKTHVPFQTRLPSSAKRQIKGKRGAARGGRVGATAKVEL